MAELTNTTGDVNTFRWGIIGTGNIASQFARGLKVLPDAELVAVGSRSQTSADAFGDEFNVPRRHASYADLAADADIDAVYVATPHGSHMENSLLCLENGKAVLCEKPFAVNAAQAERMIGDARSRGLFLMEAMWTRYFPLMDRVRSLIDEGALGEVRRVHADFGYRKEVDPDAWVFDPHEGGGGLLDVGIYPVSLASMLLGRPETVVAHAHLGETGVDEDAAVILGHPGGRLAVCSTAVRTQTPWEATIMGTEAMLRIHTPWWQPSKMKLIHPDWSSEDIKAPFEGNGYQYEAAEVMRCVRGGELESPLMPLDETLSIMRTLDEVRRQIGLSYPADEPVNAGD